MSAGASFLRPMDKPASIDLNKIQQTVKVPGPKPVERDENFEYDVEAFGMLLFSCPATIETFVEYWLAHERTGDLEPKDAITQLLQSIISGEPILQISSRKMADALGRRMRYDNAITFITNFHQNNDHHDYECSDALLIEKSSIIAEKDCPELYTSRFSIILTGLLAHDGSANFHIKKSNANQTAMIYRGFKYDSILAGCYDRSAFLLAYLLFALRFCHVMIPDDDDEEEEEEEEESKEAKPVRNITPAMRKLKMEKLTREECAFELYQEIDAFVCNIRHRNRKLESSDAQVPETLLKYHKGVHDGTKILFGVPIEVVLNPVYSLLYLEWLWKSEIWRENSTKPAAFGVSNNNGSAHQSTAGLLQIIENFWRAKSLVLYSNYYAFFEEWDSKRLLPFIEGFESLST